MTVRETSGPDRVVHYNAYPSAEINGGPAPGYSSDQATAAMERLARETLPNGIGYEWTDLTYQQILAGDTALFVFPLGVLLAFVVLAAQYESWTLRFFEVLDAERSLLEAQDRLAQGEADATTAFAALYKALGGGWSR